MYMLSLPRLMWVYVLLEFTIFLWNVVIRCLILVISSEYLWFFLANKKIGFDSGFDPLFSIAVKSPESFSLNKDPQDLWIFYYIKCSQRHLLASIESNWSENPILIWYFRIFGINNFQWLKIAKPVVIVKGRLRSTIYKAVDAANLIASPK